MVYRIGGRLETWFERCVTDSTRRKVVEIAGSEKSFSERIRKLRLFAGVHQKDLVQYLRLPQDRMSDLERGHRQATEDEIAALADFFGIDRHLLVK